MLCGSRLLGGGNAICVQGVCLGEDPLPGWKCTRACICMHIYIYIYNHVCMNTYIYK